MTEAEWNTCTDPTILLRDPVRSLGTRKLRLFACACCKRVWPLLSRPSIQHAVHIAEQFADGEVSIEQLRSNWLAVRKALSTAPLGTKWEEALMVALHATSEPMGVYSASLAADAAARALDQVWRQSHPAASNQAEEFRRRLGSPEERAYQCEMLRDLLPFSAEAPKKVQSLLGDLNVRQLAQAIYAEERFQDMPVLADALEDAGCEDPEILEHCRGKQRIGIHVRGCWLLDTLLGRDD